MRHNVAQKRVGTAVPAVHPHAKPLHRTARWGHHALPLERDPSVGTAVPAVHPHAEPPAKPFDRPIHRAARWGHHALPLERDPFGRDGCPSRPPARRAARQANPSLGAPRPIRDDSPTCMAILSVTHTAPPSPDSFGYNAPFPRSSHPFAGGDQKNRVATKYQRSGRYIS